MKSRTILPICTIKHLQGPFEGHFFCLMNKNCPCIIAVKTHMGEEETQEARPKSLGTFARLLVRKYQRQRCFLLGQKETGVQSEAKPGFKARPPNPPHPGFATHQFASLLCYCKLGILTVSSIFMALFSLIK